MYVCGCLYIAYWLQDLVLTECVCLFGHTGLPAAKAHVAIRKRLSSLQEEEKGILIAKYDGTKATDTQVQNNILMMLLRAHFENKQAAHSHTTLPGGGVRSVCLAWDERN